MSEKEPKKAFSGLKPPGGSKTDDEKKDDENSILKRFVIFIPEVTMEMVDIFYRIFN